MKQLKKVLALLLAATMVAGMLAGCGKKEEVSDEKQEEIEASDTEEAVTITGWGAMTFNDQVGYTSYSEQLAWKEIEKRLNITVDWTNVPAADKSAQFSLMMSDSGNLPDFIVDMSPLVMEEFGRAGALIALNDYITPELMPNFCALMEEYDGVKASITSADGNIYFFPRIPGKTTRYWAGLFMRSDFLEEVGKEVPTTTDEFYDVLVAFKENIDTVTYPLSVNATMLKSLVWSWGIGARGTSTSATDDAYINSEGQLAYAPTEDAYREALIYLNKLYEDGLLNPDWNSLTGDDIRTLILNKEAAGAEGSFAGILTSYNNLLKADGQEPMTYVDPLYGPTGARIRQGHHIDVDGNYASAISVNCDNVEAVVRMVDYLYSDEGRELVFWGVEGETFTRNGEIRELTEAVSTSDLGVATYMNNYNLNASCYTSCMLTDYYQVTLDEIAKAGNESLTAVSKTIDDIRMPALRYSEEEITEVNTILADLNAYVDENFANFINGVIDIEDDSAWETYLKGFDGLRLEELMGYHQTAYDRWISYK